MTTEHRRPLRIVEPSDAALARAEELHRRRRRSIDLCIAAAATACGLAVAGLLLWWGLQ